MAMKEVMNMNKRYRKEDRRDSFITNHLLTYLATYIDSSDEQKKIADAVAGLYIFPYKTADGIYIGSLKEPGISWYFPPENDKNKVSSGGYRIFAEEVIKLDQIKKIHQFLLTNKYVSEYTDNVVVNDLIQRMRAETDYTELWWTCAYDVFRLWHPDSYIYNMSVATESIDNDYFLFDESYAGWRLKNELIKYHIFRDIITPVAKSCFWDRLKRNEREDAISFLKDLGVPATFVGRTGINPAILHFAEAIGNDTYFPVAEDDMEAGVCRLSHALFMDVIWKESEEAFMKAVNPDSADSYMNGIVVQNTDGDYVPLSWHLFYDAEELEEEKATEDEASVTEDTQEEALEYLHIDVSQYDENFIRLYNKIHEFAEVKGAAEEYDIDEEDTLNFYKWIWRHSKHTELVQNILWYFTGEEKERNIVEDEGAEFALSVLNEANIDDDGYCFDLKLPAKMAFQHADTVNKIRSTFHSIYTVVINHCNRLDAHEYLRKVLDATETTYEKKGIVENDDIWQHVYLADDEENLYDNKYVQCQRPYDDIKSLDVYEDALLLWPSEDELSYIRALAAYVRTHFSLDVHIADAQDVNWREAYINLARGIHDFVSRQMERRNPEDMRGYISRMNDIESFGEEKRLWLRLKKERDIILDCMDHSCPIDLDSWRSFIESRYRGRCQLCGKGTITGIQNTHFYTYRIVKKRDNALANMKYNLLSLCPSCWGELMYGDYMGQDMQDLLGKGTQYAEYMEMMLEDHTMEDHFKSLVSGIYEDQVLLDEEQEKLEGFQNPIVCRVMINGKDRLMAFSWEHFIRLAFILHESGKYEG